jgi:hypothetical protein
MHADTVLRNGLIHTQYDLQPIVSALAIRDGKIVGLGKDDEMLSLLAPGGESIDLGGKLVIPGLVDAHVHLSWFADTLVIANLTDTKSAQEAAEKVKQAAASLPSGSWVRGRGWSQERWPDQALPDASILDQAVPDHPVYLVAQSGHAAWVNSLALRKAGITRDTPDPDGGQIGRDAAGNPDGVLYEDAIKLVLKVIPGLSSTGLIPDLDPDILVHQLKAAIQKAHSSGLTGLHDFDGISAFTAYQRLHQAGELTLRIVKNIPAEYLDHALAMGLRWGFGDDMLRIGGVKSFADGALGPRTAWMIEPYDDQPGNTGMSVTDPEELMERVSKASAGGLPSTIHAIGDRAVHNVLNVYESVRKEEYQRGVPVDALRHRIEHVQVIHPDDVGRLGKLGLIASMQPIHATSDMTMADRGWGARAEYSYNWRLQMEAGAMLAFGSDAPVEPIDPLFGIHAAVTRRRADGSPGLEGWRSGERGRLSVDEAVRGFTIGPAYTAGLEHKLGRLAPGFLADLTVLGQDIYSCDPMSIPNTPVHGTLVGGRWAHRMF